MRVFLTAAVLLSTIWTAVAQDTAPPTITSTGEASEKAAPTHVEFQFSAIFEEDTLANSSVQANAFPDRFKQALKTHKLGDGTVSFRTPQIATIKRREVVVQGTIRFALPGIAELNEQVLAYATLCDTVAALGIDSNATIDGPTLIVENTELIEQKTLKRATENALYKADAIAQILNTRIYEVHSVVIEKLLWHSKSRDAATAPGLDSKTCEAVVSLTYLHQP